MKIIEKKRKNGEKIKLYGKSLFYILGVSIIFLIISIIKAASVKYPLDFRTFVQIALILMPAMYVFCLVNIFSVKEIIRLMEFTLTALILIYFCEPTHHILDFFNISNWMDISVLNSNSFTESSLCAEPFLQLFLFFYYFSNIKNIEFNSKRLKICKWISFVFTILAFKRLGIAFAIGIIILEKIVDVRGKISPKFTWGFAILFTIGTIIYTKFMQGQIFTNIDVYKFTTGRDYILSLWEKKEYLSYGYGTSMLVIGRYLEMDLIQIYLELGIFALFIFSLAFFKIANKSIYSILIMIYAFANMLTASSLPWSLGWIILLITVLIISSGKCEEEDIEIGIKERNFQRLFSNKYKKIEEKEEV